MRSAKPRSTHPRSAHRAAVAIAAVLCLASASVAAAPAPASSRACAGGHAGQPELQPLQPLTLVTAAGRFQFQVEYADSDQTREAGLMCRTSLAPDRGMLFDFLLPIPDVGVWMKDTLIPLDIVFIDSSGEVISIVANARPMDETPLRAASAPRAALELAGGRAAEIGLKPGDKVVHQIFQP